MQKDVINGIEMEYVIEGNNKEKSILFIHGGIIADANIPLFSESSLQNYQRIHYHRRGYGGSTKCLDRISMLDQALDCKNLLDYLEIKIVHIVGHSLGGTIALQFALEYPQYVSSLSLLEPALTGYGQQGNYGVIDEFRPLIEMYDKGQTKKAIDIFMINAVGEDYLELIKERLSSNAYDLAIRDANTYFHYEIPSMSTWRLPLFSSKIYNIDDNTLNQNTKQLRLIPVLNVRGSISGQRSKEREEIIVNLFPKTKIVVVENAKHMLQIINPSKVAEEIATFIKNL